MLRRAGLLAASALLCACAFDASGLAARLCSASDPCAVGSCVEGVCVSDVAPTDAGDSATDLGELDGTQPDADAGPDGSPDGGSCTAGEVRCVDGQVVECVDGSEILVDDCAGEVCGELGCTCLEAACVPRTCVPGARTCNGLTVFSCGPEGLDQTAVETCSDGLVCVDGECVPGDCAAGSVTCSGDLLVSCGPSGTVSEVIDCLAQGAVCLAEPDPACVPTVCTPGSTRCSGQDVLACDDSGTDEAVAETCSGTEVCFDGQCRFRACEPGTRCIDSDTLEICDPSGTASSEVDCDATEVCSAGACVARACVPGTRRCGAGGGVQTCVDPGADWSPEAACAPGEVCFDGTCSPTLCAPGALFCDGAVRSQCSGDGLSATAIETCSFGCSPDGCDASVCGDAVVDPASETCDDANASACDGCDACSLRTHLVSGASAATLSGPSWVPAERDFTLEAWVNVSSEAGALFGIGLESETDTAAVVVSDGNPVFIVRLSGDATLALRGDARITGAGWVHVAAVRFDRTALALYVDGRVVGVQRVDTDRTSVDATAGRIWVGSDSVRTPATARVDELRVSSGRRYARTFVPSRFTSVDATTIHAWHFDDGVGSVARSVIGSAELSLRGLTWGTDTCLDAPAGRIVCGDGVLAPFEGCDDGDTEGGDGCSATCATESRCADGVARGGAPSGGGCYLRLITTANWDDARTDCQTWGGDLVSINDTTENAWLFGQFGAGGWIGFTDSGWQEGTWRWISGQAAPFSSWSSGEPNDGDFFSTEDCAHITTGGGWNDADCDEARSAICERGE